ncbi:hypothetical protein MMC30_004028 [Trapelia coarctata]|nr:hypothetical protein [Trapelia coarctata]
MDDLVGLDWVASSSSSTSKPPPMNNGNYYPALRPTPPISGRSTPALQNTLSSATKPATNHNVPNKSSTPANDSFASLLPFNATQSTKSLSLQDQQKLLQKQKEKEKQDRQRQFDTRFGSTDNTPWPGLSNGRATPDRVASAPKYTGTDEYGGQKLSTAINKPFAAISGVAAKSSSKKSAEDLDDLLAAFDADTPVDSSSNMPPISSTLASHNVASRNVLSGRHAASNDRARHNSNDTEDFDDVLFGLGTSIPSKIGNAVSPPDVGEDDDDVLGLLGRPVSELPPPQSYIPEPSSAVSKDNADPADRAVAELVDMGFPADRAKIALDATESGLNVQAAVGWLLNQAHEESRSRSTARETGRRNSNENPEGISRTKPRDTSNIDTDAPVPAWMRQRSRSNSTQRREDSRSPANGERDPAKVAADIGSNLFKTANSLWKTGAKKLNQAVSDFNSDSDSSQPKWMRESRNERQDGKKFHQTRTSHDDDEDKDRPHNTKARSASNKATPSITDEALMLESGDARPRPRHKPQPQPARPEARPTYSTDSSRDQSPVVSARNALPAQPKFMQQQQQPVVHPRSKLSRQTIEDESAQAYVSAARRKKTTPNPPSREPDLLIGASLPTRPSQSKPASSFQPQAKAPTPVSSRPPVPVRKIPPLSNIALKSSTSHRQAGNNAFKLGNYAQATVSYTSSLSDLPASHPLAIVLLTNRALSNLKTGDPKACTSDADAALTTIGASKGQGETIDIGSEEGTKPMSIYWGKAMTRKAEALEQLERWADAAKAWKECIEAGVGGSTSIQGRDRCEKAAAGPSAPSVPATRPTTAARKPPSRSAGLAGRPTLTPAASAEAVTRLRAANAAAERADEEKFALADSVDERLTSWRKGKEGNLRALLASLDQVLWEGAGWRKVGMGELIVPGKVKVVYMRGIGKVHPDKVSDDGDGVYGGRDLLMSAWNIVTAYGYDGAGYD